MDLKRERTSLTQIYTHECVRDYFKKHGCELISEFKNVKQILSYRCVCGEIGTTNFYSYRNSLHKKCIKCVRKKANKPNKLNFEYVKNFFKENNCELLETTYINSSTKMAYICSCGKKDYKTWNKFRTGQRCKDCAINQNAEKQRTDTSYVENFLKKHGFSIANGKYVNANFKMLLICPCGKQTERTWSSVKQSPRCNCSIHYTKPLKRKFSKEELINFYWKLKNDLGRYPSLEDLKKNPSSPSPSVYERKFGGWVRFLESIGVMTSDRWYVDDIETLKRMYADYSYEDINDALIKKRSKSTIQHKANSLGLKKSYKAKFGKEKFSNDYLITFLRNFYDKYNRTPVAKDFAENDLNYDTFTKRFGSWNNALKKAGLPINRERSKNLSNNDLLKMKEMYEAGVNMQDIAKHFNYTHTAPIYYHLNKMNVNLTRNNRWSKKQIHYLKAHYPNAEWKELLKNLAPFSKEGITTKAYKLGIKRNSNFYTEKEEKILRKFYGKVSFHELLKMLPNRTESSVVSKVNHMGLKIREFWSEEDINMLKKHYQTSTDEELLKMFKDRSWSSIQSMATKNLNLKRTKEYYKNKKEKIRDHLIKELIEYANALGRTPTSVEVQKNRNLQGISTYIRYFDGYRNACLKAGLDPNQSIFGSSIHCISLNGDICLSKKEKEITDLFIKNNITYEKEVLYKDILGKNNIPNIRVDWFVNNRVIVEYFGMTDKDYYKKRANYKIEFCKKYDIPLIPLYPDDLTNNYKGLKEKFKTHGINFWNGDGQNEQIR